MISADKEAEILRVYHAEKWKVGTIARQLGVHHGTVRRVLAQAGQAPGLEMVRASMIEPYLPFVQETLKKYPTLCASRLYEMVRQRGYPGGADHFRHMVSRYRPRLLSVMRKRGKVAMVQSGNFLAFRFLALAFEAERSLASLSR